MGSLFRGMESSMTTGSHRLVFSRPSPTITFLPWTSSSFVGSFSVEKAGRPKKLDLITLVWTCGALDQASTTRPPRSPSARGSSYTTWYVSWKQGFHYFWLENDKMFKSIMINRDIFSAQNSNKTLFFLQRKPNPLWSYCLPRDGKAPLCSSFSKTHSDFNFLKLHIIYFGLLYAFWKEHFSVC